MQVAVVFAVFEGLSFSELNDAALLETALDESLAAGGFSLIHKHVHCFDPQGVTAIAVVGESHVALHSWPEEGVLFVDVASCTTLEAGRASMEAIRIRFPSARVSIREALYEGSNRAQGELVWGEMSRPKEKR
jgi:S-adenosylmethionine decarboxylase